MIDSKARPGHVLPAGEKIVLPVRYEFGGNSFCTSGEDAHLPILVRFNDNTSQEMINVRLSHRMSYREFVGSHRSMPKPYQGLIEITSWDSHLVITRLNLLCVWHDVEQA